MPAVDVENLLLLEAAHLHGFLIQCSERWQGLTQPDEFTIELPEPGMLTLVAQVVIELGMLEHRVALRIRRFSLPGKGGKLLTPAVAYGFNQRCIRMTDEVLKL